MSGLVKAINFLYEKGIYHIREEAREVIVYACFTLLYMEFMLYHSGSFDRIFYTHTQRHIIGLVLLLVIALFSMKGPILERHYNRVITALLFCGGLGICFAGFMHPIGSGYLVFGCMLLLVYPLLYVVWSNRGDYATLFDIISRTYVFVYLCYLIYCILIRTVYPYAGFDGRISGTFTNPNVFGMMGIALVGCSLYMMYRKRASALAQMFYCIGVCGGIAVAFLSQSRACMIIWVLMALATIVFVLKLRKTRSGDSHLWRRGVVALIVVVVVCVAVCGAVVMNAAGEPDEDSSTASFVERWSFEEKSLDGFFSGRIGIWKHYSEELNLTGHDVTQIDWVAWLGYDMRHAHNNYLEYSFRCGLPVGIVMTIIEIYAVLLALKYLFSSKNRREYKLFCILFVIIYLIESLVEISTMSMERFPPFFFYLALCGMTAKDEEVITDSIEKEPV